MTEPTPLTDAEAAYNNYYDSGGEYAEAVHAYFARGLERRLATMQRDCDLARAAFENEEWGNAAGRSMHSLVREMCETSTHCRADLNEALRKLTLCRKALTGACNCKFGNSCQICEALAATEPKP